MQRLVQSYRTRVFNLAVKSQLQSSVQFRSLKKHRRFTSSHRGIKALSLPYYDAQLRRKN